MVLARIGPLSCAKIVGSIYFCLGVIIGSVFALLALFGAGIASDEPQAWLGVLLGVGAVVFLPLLYGGLTFLVALLVASIYNLAAKHIGGVELDLR